MPVYRQNCGLGKFSIASIIFVTGLTHQNLFRDQQKHIEKINTMLTI